MKIKACRTAAANRPRVRSGAGFQSRRLDRHGVLADDRKL